MINPSVETRLGWEGGKIWDLLCPAEALAELPGIHQDRATSRVPTCVIPGEYQHQARPHYLGTLWSLQISQDYGPSRVRGLTKTPQTHPAEALAELRSGCGQQPDPPAKYIQYQTCFWLFSWADRPQNMAARTS